MKSLASDDHFLQRMCAGCIANLCSTNEEKSTQVVEAGAIDILLSILDEENPVHAMAIKALTNICTLETAIPAIVSKGGMDKIVKKFLVSEDEDIVIESFVMLQSLCELKTHALDFIDVYKGLDLSIELTRKFAGDPDTEDVAVAALELLHDLAEQEDARIKFDTYKTWQSLLDIFYTVESETVREKVFKCVSQLTLDDVVTKKMSERLDEFIKISIINDHQEGEISKASKEIELSAMMIIANMIRDDESCINVMNKHVDNIIDRKSVV